MRKTTLPAKLLAALLCVGLLLSLAPDAQAADKAQEKKLLAVVTSADAELKAKFDTLRVLQRVATKDAVPTLAKLLGDEKLSHMARYAMEPIQDPAVDAALRDALDRVKGRHLVGVISSLGRREDEKAVPALAKLLGHDDAEVAKAAARALGSIGTAEAVQALQAVLPKAPAAQEWALYEGLLRCAESLQADGQTEQAMAIYDRLRGIKSAPNHVRTAALRGAVLVRGEDGLPLLMEAVRSDDYILVTAAARTAMEMETSAVTQALAGELGKLSPDKQILMAQTLSDRGEAEAVPALLALAKKAEKEVRVAAIRALPGLGDGSVAPVLVELLADEDSDVAGAARDALGGLGGETVDQALVAMVKDPKSPYRKTAIELVGQRRVESAIPALLKAAQDADEAIRVASINVLGEMAGQEQFPALVDLLVKTESSAAIRALEKALAAICSREAKPAADKVTIHKALYGDLPDGKKADVTKKVAAMIKAGALAVDATNSNFGDPVQGTRKKLSVRYAVGGTTQTKTVDENETLTLTAGITPPALVDELRAALDKAPPKPKLALLRVLRSAGGEKALAAVCAATKDPNKEISNAAVSLLASWPSAEALPEVIKLAKSAKDQRTKVLALRGCFRLIPMQDATAEQKLAQLKDALGLAERTEEKRLALAALAEIPTARSLEMALAHLDDKGLVEEASLAAVGIAEAIVRQHPKPVAEAMQRVIKATKNKATAKQARNLLAVAKKRS